MLPTSEPSSSPPPAGWRHHEDRWNGFAVNLPPGWRAVADGAKVYALGEDDCAVLYWPQRAPESLSMDELVERVTRELAGGDPTFDAWCAPGAGRERAVSFRRLGRDGRELRGALRVQRVAREAVIVRGYQSPAAREASLRPVAEQVARSFTPVQGPERIRTEDPSEGAWSVEHPAGWIVRGGVDRVRAQGGGIITWSVEDPRTGARAANEGTVLPMREPSAMSWLGAGMDWRVRPFSDAETCAREVLLPLARAQRSDIVLDGTVLDAEVQRLAERGMREGAARLGGTAQVHACLARIRYTEGAVLWREVAVIVAWRVVPTGGGYWFINVGPTVRAPAELFDAMLPTLDGIARSFRADPAWEHREMDRAGRRMAEDRRNAERQRAAILKDTMDYIHKVDEEIREHREATRAEVSRIASNTILGKEDALDEDGYSRKVDAGYETYWSRGDTVVGSNSSDFDNHLAADGWKKMKVY